MNMNNLNTKELYSMALKLVIPIMIQNMEVQSNAKLAGGVK